MFSDYNKVDFMEECTTTLEDQDTYNPWYLETIPDFIEPGQVCEAYQDLFEEMALKHIYSIERADSYSLILTIELDFNAKEESIYG